MLLQLMNNLSRWKLQTKAEVRWVSHRHIQALNGFLDMCEHLPALL